MISVTEALELIRRAVQPLAAQHRPIEEALGLVLAEDVMADGDSPPHDKAVVDGYAVRASDAMEPGAELLVVEQIMAGDVPQVPITRGRAAQIMTGAPLPTGADAVVMVEHTESHEEGELPLVRVHRSVREGQNIMRRGASMRSGQCVLPAGQKLRPIEIGLLAEIGRATVLVHPAPSVAVISTGNELVAHREKPRPGQIRNSNGPMLSALVARAGGLPRGLGIAQDRRDDLEAAVARGLDSNILVLSGGVSAGVLDLTPRVLRDLGVAQVFHKVNLKPGKPLWFGIRVHEQGGTLVFGLPGNPVSSLVCFELFVRPALRALAGEVGSGHDLIRAKLAVAHEHRGDRPTYFPARSVRDANEYVVNPLAWQGSADLRTLVDANALIHFPPGDRDYAASDLVDVLFF